MLYKFADRLFSKPVWRIPLLCVQRKIPDDGKKNCSKHVYFHSKNKFEKLVHLVDFIIRNSSILSTCRNLLELCADLVSQHVIGKNNKSKRLEEQ